MRLQQTLLPCFRILVITILATNYLLASNPKTDKDYKAPKSYVHQKWTELNESFQSQLKRNLVSSSPFKNSQDLFSENYNSESWVTFSCNNGVISNPEFELDFVGWSYYNNSNIVNDAWSGSKAAQVSANYSGGVGQNISAYEGQVYSVHAYAKKSGSEQAWVGMKYMDATYNTLDEISVEVTSSNFQEYSTSLKAPEGTAYVQVYGWKSYGSGTATYDAFCFEKWEVDVPVCSDVKCEISPSWGRYVWAMNEGNGEWKDYDDGGLFLCDNGDGTLSILGNIINAHDSDWDSGTGVTCGAQDGWELNLMLYDRQTWAEFGGNYVQYNGCDENRYDWDYWEISGTLTGTGCNVGRTINITSSNSGYRAQVGWGGNSQSCDFGISTWMIANENGAPINADLYIHVDADCYYDTRPEDCADGVDNDNDGLADCYDSDCAPQLITNASFEDVGSTVFNTTFQGNPARALPNGSSLIPDWYMAYACGGNCYDSYWIDDTADNVNNPKGDYFLWLPGSSYCAAQSLSLDVDKCYEVTMTVAAWSEPSPQLSTNVAIEMWGGGIDDNGGLLTIFGTSIPASPNWQNLSWETLTFTWSPPVSATTNFYISQYNTSTTARGLVVDEILVKEICCAGGIDPDISCEDGRDVEYNFVGINHDVPKTLPLDDVSNMDSVVAEIVYKGGDAGSTIQVEDDNGNFYSASRQYLGGSAYVYRTVLPPTSSVTYSNTTNEDDAQSLAAFVYRNGQPGKTVVAEFTTLRGYNNTYTLDFEIPKDVKDRNIKLVLPISEVTWDNRRLDFEVTAGDVSVSESRTWGPSNEGFPNGCCVDTIEFYLEDVAPDVDMVYVDVISPGNGVGQSFVIAATIAVEIFCEEVCGNGIDDDGDGYVDNEDQDCLCPEISTPQDPNMTICEGEEITFEVHSNAPNPPYALIEFYRFDSPQTNPYTSTDAKTWLGVFSNNNNGTGFFTSSDFPNSNTSDRTYYMYGCLKPEPQDPETCFPFVEYVITVKSSPTADAGTSTTICGGTSFNLSGSASGGAGPYTYAWDNGLGNGSNKTVNPNSTTTYTLTVTGGNGCTATDELTLSVNPSPSVDAGDDVSICITDAVTLNATGSGALSPSTFQWSHGLGTGDTKVVSPSTTTTYGVTLTSGNGCNATDNVTVNISNCIEDCTDGIDNDLDGKIDCLDEDCAPDAFAGMDISICTGSTATIEASVIDGNGSYVYTWDNGLGGGATQVVSPLETTTYEVTITNAAGCFGTASVTVTVNLCPEDCTDGIDNDGDGLVDCDDPDCILTSAPQLADDNFTTCPAIPLTERVTYNDGNLQDPSFSIIHYPINGTVSIDGTGKFTYTPLTTECGTDVFTYQVCNQASGCCDLATVNITVGDNTSPTLINIPADVTISCDELVPDPTQVLAYDDCPGIFIEFEEVTQEYAVGACESYVITRTWEAEDLCGNTATGGQLITVEDLEAPELFRVYTLANGKRVVAGVSQRASNNWKYQKFPITFSEAPMIFSQVNSNNELSAVMVQQRYTSTQGFELRLAEQEGSDDVHTFEQVAWVAIEPGAVAGLMEANTFANAYDVAQTLTFGQTFSSTPIFIAAPQTVNETDPYSIRLQNGSSSSIEVFLQEETSKDGEVWHAPEELSYVAFEPSAPFVDEDGFEFGETGKLDLTNAWATVNLSGDYVKPAVILGGVSGTDGSPVTIRVRNVTNNSFEVRLQEWDSQDGVHGLETVSYLVVEGGLPFSSTDYCDPNGTGLDLGVNVFFSDNCDDQISIDYTEASILQTNGLETSRNWVGLDDCGNPTVYNRVDNCTVAALKLRSVLQGANVNNIGGDLMRDNLRSLGYLPNTEPYTGLGGYAHQGKGGGETISGNRFDETGDDAIVDWMFLEVRNMMDPDEVLATRSVLIQRDGDIENHNGGDVVYFPELLEGQYFVTLRHRNHLGLTTEKAWNLSSVNIPTIDYSDLTVDVKGNITGGTISGSNRSMWAGDFNGDRKVIYQGPNNDIFYLFSRVLSDSGNTSFLANYISSGYDRNDFNMDGKIIYQGPNNDRSMMLFHATLNHPDNTSFLANFIVSEKLP